MTSVKHIPPLPQEMIDFLTRQTGVEPTLQRKGRNLVLEHRNDRVRMTATFSFSGGVWHQSASTLEVDGQRTVLAATAEEYVRVFTEGAEPTGEHQDEYCSCAGGHRSDPGYVGKEKFSPAVFRYSTHRNR